MGLSTVRTNQAIIKKYATACPCAWTEHDAGSNLVWSLVHGPNVQAPFPLGFCGYVWRETIRQTPRHTNNIATPKLHRRFGATDTNRLCSLLINHAHGTHVESCCLQVLPGILGHFQVPVRHPGGSMEWFNKLISFDHFDCPSWYRVGSRIQIDPDWELKDPSWSKLILRIRVDPDWAHGSKLIQIELMDPSWSRLSSMIQVDPDWELKNPSLFILSPRIRVDPDWVGSELIQIELKESKLIQIESSRLA